MQNDVSGTNLIYNYKNYNVNRNKQWLKHSSRTETLEEDVFVT